MYAFGWFTTFVVIGVGSYWATKTYGFEFKHELEKHVYYFFVGSAAVYTAWIAIRSCVAIAILKVTRRDWIYSIDTESTKDAA